jgi:hypothetical protein
MPVKRKQTMEPIIREYSLKTALNFIYFTGFCGFKY